MSTGDKGFVTGCESLAHTLDYLVFRISLLLYTIRILAATLKILSSRQIVWTFVQSRELLLVVYGAVEQEGGKRRCASTLPHPSHPPPPFHQAQYSRWPSSLIYLFDGTCQRHKCCDNLMKRKVERIG